MRLKMLALVAMSALAGLTLTDGAVAADPAEELQPVDLGAGSLVYNWPVGEPLHYRAQLYLAKPRGIRFIATENLDARVSELTMALLVRCMAAPPEKRGQEMTCEVHRVEAGAATRTNEDLKARKIFTEYVGDLMRATIQLEWSPTGRLRTVDLEGLEKDVSRAALKHEYLRLLVRHALSPLEIEMPKDGDPKGKAWRQKGSPLAMRLPSTTGTAGGVRMLNEVLGADADGNVVIRTVGEGTVQDNAETSLYTVGVFLAGQSRFSPERGVLMSSEQTFQGAFTAQAGTTGTDLYINQVAMIELLPNFDDVDEAYQERAKAAAAPKEETKPKQVLDINDVTARSPDGDGEAPEGEAPEVEAPEGEAPEVEAPEGEDPAPDEAE